ncbi:MAG: UDP-N-acetylmuramoyl-L-alanyl-D-glutamate--2,6-diaminopimelate ligase, partial [Clostridia bacterium]|nr:UDP-N-acetylmuramoyl-L-alanyl-D-glutamate--2,6-diaminopimelate ligase [Clostridia bacterium]
MLLSQLFANIKHEHHGNDVEIKSLQYNSRKVEQGDLFFCIVGTAADGHKYAKQAVEQGAAALVVERLLEIDVPQILVKDSRKAMALSASEFYGNPSKEMIMVGITGTNGKTSTTYMLKAIAEAAGKKVGLIGTIRNMIGDEIIDTERTTPESVDLHRILRLMRDEGVDIVVMEVSSHSLDQNRVYGIEFDVAEFTNLTQDHLDYHKTFERYLAAKKKLFKVCKAAVINKDDINAGKISEGLEVPI